MIDIEIDRKIKLKIDKYNGHLDRYIEMKININKARDIRPQRHALANHQLELIFSSNNCFSSKFWSQKKHIIIKGSNVTFYK